MATRSYPLASLRADVRKYADLGPDTTTGRHTNADVNAAINRSWQAFRELCCENGSQIFLKGSFNAAGSMATGAIDAATAFGSVPAPADAEHVFGVDIVLSNNQVRRLSAVSFDERNEFYGFFGQQNGTPQAWFLYDLNLSQGSSGSIALLPAPDQSYAYKVWYLPIWTDITSDVGTFDDAGLGAHDWVVPDCVCRFAMADADMAQTYQLAQVEREKAEARIKRAIHSTQRGGPIHKLDMAGRRRRSAVADFWRRL